MREDSAANGVTRREFEELKREMQAIDRNGTRGLDGMRIRMDNIAQDVLNLDAKAARSSDVTRLERKVDGLTKAMWTVAAALITGVLMLLVALATGAFSA